MKFGETKKDKKNNEIYDVRMYLYTKYSYKKYWATILHIIIKRGEFKEKIKIKNVHKIFTTKKKFRYSSYITQDHNAISVMIPGKMLSFVNYFTHI